jgi:hypothetical protein
MVIDAAQQRIITGAVSVAGGSSVVINTGELRANGDPRRRRGRAADSGVFCTWSFVRVRVGIEKTPKNKKHKNICY